MNSYVFRSSLIVFLLTYFIRKAKLYNVSGKKNVLIVTDGAEKARKIAKEIAAALKGNKVLIKDASAFVGTDILPAEVLFFGCSEPSPSSFGYIEELLQHINLARRPLGIFSSASRKSIQYLARISKDSEAALYKEPFLAENSRDIERWSTLVLAGKN